MRADHQPSLLCYEESRAGAERMGESQGSWDPSWVTDAAGGLDLSCSWLNPSSVAVHGTQQALSEFLLDVCMIACKKSFHRPARPSSECWGTPGTLPSHVLVVPRALASGSTLSSHVSIPCKVVFRDELNETEKLKAQEAALLSLV